MKKSLLIIALAIATAISAEAQQFVNSSVTWSNTLGSQTRSMIICVPANYNASNSYALVIGMHGLGDTPNNYINNPKISGYVTDPFFGNVIFVCPNEGAANTSWFLGEEDFGILTAIRNKVNQSYTIDYSKVFVQGFSLGGKSSFLHGLEEASILKGIITHSGGFYGDEDLNNDCASVVSNNCAAFHHDFKYSNAPLLKVCVTVGAGETNLTALDQSDFGTATPADRYPECNQLAAANINSNGGDALFITDPTGSHNLPPISIAKQCWTHINQATAAVNNDAGINNISAPNGTICSGNITPSVTLKNFGLSNLTAVTINYLVDGNAQAPFSWSGNLAPNGTVVVSLPSVSVAAGAHTFNANTTMPNNVSDQLSSNDAAIATNFTVVTSGSSLPFVQGFEGSYLPSGWIANNPDGAMTWAKTTLASKTGSASVFMDYSNYNAGNVADDIVTPALDLASISNPNLTFQVAYSLWTDPNGSQPFSDTLQVLVSTDCGATWTSVYKKYSLSLVTATPAFTATQFIPAANQWRLETINLNAYASSTNAMIKFRGICDFENSLFIDDINIDATVGIGIENASNDQNVNIFPTLATDVINVFLMDINGVDEITIVNAVGQVIYRNGTIDSKINSINMSAQASGVYFVKIVSGNHLITKKVMLTK